MRMREAGWVWEGQGIDPGVRPSIYGLGEGAAYFGLKRANFLFHPNDHHALTKLSHLEEVTCDLLQSYLALDCEASERGEVGAPARTLAEAERVSLLSLEFPHISGGFFDDLRGVMHRHGYTIEQLAATRAALASHNPALRLWGVVYAHELGDVDFWRSVSPYVDVITIWVWQSSDLPLLDTYVDRCQALFPGKPLIIGCYLRDYTLRAPVPLELVALQFERIWDYLQQGRIAGYSILGAVLIDGHRPQAEWVRDFIAAH